MAFKVQTTNHTSSTIINPARDEVFQPGTRVVIAVMPGPGVRGGTLSIIETPGPTSAANRIVIRSGDQTLQLIPGAPQPVTVSVAILDGGRFTATAGGLIGGPLPIGGAIATVATLPARTRINVEGRTNAQRIQRATLLLDNGRQYAWEGQGEGNRPFVDAAIETHNVPFHGGRVPAAVILESAPGKDQTFTPSRVDAASLDAGPLHERLFVAEDAADQGENDCVFRLSWWQRYWL